MKIEITALEADYYLDAIEKNKIKENESQFDIINFGPWINEGKSEYRRSIIKCLRSKEYPEAAGKYFSLEDERSGTWHSASDESLVFTLSEVELKIISEEKWVPVDDK